MAGRLRASPAGAGFCGVSEIFQYENSDGRDPDTVCGQAACATLLTHLDFRLSGVDTLRDIEKNFPPDMFGGRFGTSPLRIAQILTSAGSGTLTIGNTEELKASIKRRWPVICLIQNSGGFGGIPHGAHWFVAFAYDTGGVFVTNYTPNYLTWTSFEEKWSSPISTLASVVFRAVTMTTRRVTDSWNIA